MSKNSLSLITLHLSLIEDIGPSTIDRILNSELIRNEPELLYTMREHDLVAATGISLAKAEIIKKGLADRSLLEKELTLIEKSGIYWLTRYEPGYPYLLAGIPGAPSILYFQGAPFDDAQLSVAVVGSRQSNNYGTRVVKKLVPELVNYGCTIVSGGALGIDSAAHQEAIDHGGKTIVVLGSGLLRPYPASNKKLFERICQEGGTITSAFPLTMEGFAGNFPGRNRIISGLSRGCVVVQAAAKSGALITARYALEQGRDVFAVPGAIDDPLSAGCHALLRQGATCVTSAQDILEEWSLIEQKKEAIPEELPDSEAQLTISDSKPLTIPDQVLAACRVPSSVDDLLGYVPLSLSQLNALLFELQLSGKLEQTMGGMWVSR